VTLAYKDDLVEATLCRRLNRFVALVAVGGREVAAHVPNSGRMRELLYPGARVWLAARGGGRRTQFDLLMACDGAELVSIDARLPAALLERALEEGGVPGLEGVSIRRREVRFGDSRLDLLGEGPD
jgi:sugar fermentation stimulation protein A